MSAFLSGWFRGPLMLWSKNLESERVKASCVDANSLVGRVDVEVPTEAVHFSNMTEKSAPHSKCLISAVIDCTCHNSFKKVTIATGYVMRFVNKLKIE